MALLASLGGASLGSAAAVAQQTPPPRPDPRTLVLQPRDLPRGYEFGDDSGCGRVEASEGALEQLKSLFASAPTTGCVMELQWAWPLTPPHMRVVTSAAYVFRNAGAARRAFGARDELAIFTASLHVKARKPVRLGDRGEVVRGAGLNHPATGVVWRRGAVVALVAVESGSDSLALTLARRQERRLERPGPPVQDNPTRSNDPQLRLDDPGLGRPVYWLGPEYDPQDGQGLYRLLHASVGGPGPGQSVQLWYGGATLDIWLPAAWEKFRRTRLGRLIWDSPCARKTEVNVQGGRAEIFEGYGRPSPVEPPCPATPPDRVIAHVYYDRVVVAVDMPYCYECADRAPGGVQETVASMERLVAALHPRERRR